MSWILCIVVLCFPSVIFAYYYNKRFEETLPITTFSVILILFVFGLLDILKTGLILAILLCMAAGIVGLVMSIKAKKIIIILKQLFTPAFFIFLALSLFIWYMNRGMQLSVWDEFSHWGKVAKATILTNKISTYTNIDLLFRSYPPAMCLFQYFVSSFRHIFIEADLIRSYSILGLILFLPFLRNIEWKNKKSILSTIVLIVMAPLLFFNEYYISIYIDPMLALFFGYCMAEIFMQNHKDRFTFIRISLALSVLTLIKESGLLLAFIACATYAILKININRNYIAKNSDVKYIMIINKQFRIPKLLSWMPFIAIFIIPIFASILWNINLNLTNTPKVFSAPINWTVLFRIFTGNLIDYRNTVFNQFFTSLSKSNLTTGFLPSSFFIWVGIFVFLLTVLAILNKKESNEKYTVFKISILIGMVLYVIGMLVMYMFKFTEYEAVHLASFSRYINTYLQGIFISIAMIVITESHRIYINSQLMNLFKLGLIVLLTLFTPITSITDILLRKEVELSVNFRAPYQIYIHKFDALSIEPDSKIWIISQHTTGLDYWVLQYELLQYKVNPKFTWSLGEKSSKEDIWTLDLSVDDWAKQLYDYSYVLICKTDDSFKNRYKTLFQNESSIQANTIYKVEKDGKNIQLIRVP